jgi:di/tripeptidase
MNRIENNQISKPLPNMKGSRHSLQNKQDIKEQFDQILHSKYSKQEELETFKKEEHLEHNHGETGVQQIGHVVNDLTQSLVNQMTVQTEENNEIEHVNPLLFDMKEAGLTYSSSIDVQNATSSTANNVKNVEEIVQTFNKIISTQDTDLSKDWKFTYVDNTLNQFDITVKKIADNGLLLQVNHAKNYSTNYVNDMLNDLNQRLEKKGWNNKIDKSNKKDHGNTMYLTYLE